MNRDEERLLYRIAKLYYDENYTQADIAKELGIYRTTIGRMLQKARDRGIVKIQVQSVSNALFEIEEKIMKHFGMKEIIIVPSFKGQSNQDISRSIGKACSILFDRIIQDNDIIGVAMGKTLGNLANELHELKPKQIECLPLVGGPGGMNTDFHVNAITLRMANAFQGQSHLIDAAAIYKSYETAREILESGFMQEIIELWNKVTVAIVGIGAQISSTNMVWSGFLGESEQVELKEKQAIGDICSRFYKMDGEVVQSSFSDRTVAIELEKLRDLRYSVGVAYSSEKVDAIIGAMRGKLINTLVTDEETALEIDRWIENH